MAEETSGPATILTELKGTEVWITVSGIDSDATIEAATIALTKRAALGHALTVMRMVVFGR